MEILELVLQGSIYLSVMTTTIVVYLSINKMWSRKHEPVVAGSISVAAQLISFITIIPFLIDYSLKGKYEDAIYQFLWIVYTAFLILTGIGFWVKERRYVGVWQKLLKSLGQESHEVGNLIKSLGNLTEKKQLLEILHRLAWLDDELDERERRYIQTFTNQLDLDYEFILERQPPEEGIEKFHSLRHLFLEYFAIKPPKEQVQLLGDLVQALIVADEKITPEEEVIAEEISSMVENYTNTKTTIYYGIVIHPKNQEQEKAILQEIPKAKSEFVLGDRALIAGIFQTRRYAEIISEFYREQGWFTVVYDNFCISNNTNEHGLIQLNSNQELASIEGSTS